MTRYRTTVPMLPPSAFPETIRLQQMRTHYLGDEVAHAAAADIDRLLAAGYVEPVADTAPVAT